MDPSELPRPAVAAGLLVGVLAVSTSAILARFAMGAEPALADAPAGAAPALGVAFWRTAFGALALAPWGWRSARRRAVRLDRATHRTLAASGLALGLHFALWQGSLALTTVASSVTLVTMSPLFVALGSWWFLREPADRRTWLGMAVTMVGAVTIGLADATAIDLGPGRSSVTPWPSAGHWPSRATCCSAARPGDGYRRRRTRRWSTAGRRSSCSRPAC